ncbi:MAG: hypothetical protein QM493_06220 [Sulfurovum sp.]
MIDKILLGVLLTTSLIWADTDSDMDGVIDRLDKCADTPFLSEVDASGCLTNTLTLIDPDERGDDTLEVDIGYGISNDEDAIDRHKQNLITLQVGYYLNDWSYTIRTGYYRTGDDNDFSDTTLKIKRRFTLTDSLKLSLGGSAKLPTYEFAGNKTDYTLYTSIVYYPTTQFSLLAGWSHTFVKDTESINPIKDTDSIYLGVGYLYNKDIYTNITYTQVESKFAKKHTDKAIIATLFYTISPKYFTTITYSQEIGEDDIDNKISLRFGWRVW